MCEWDPCEGLVLASAQILVLTVASLRWPSCPEWISPMIGIVALTTVHTL